ncbi:hypothetical protein LO763_19865 [Glycomyces sp. A-F 0318]|uniref:hypothetical protein n=1 Tax=Glycomyces amatae TaxID=2881355 RepID=UPI001E542344|nr:hypothetical protein [Glycomyces amatae]MCD0445870.1 hypothetical protein [Glycomyces amatae]
MNTPASPAPPRYCARRDCDNELPPSKTKPRKYCSDACRLQAAKDSQSEQATGMDVAIADFGDRAAGVVAALEAGEPRLTEIKNLLEGIVGTVGALQAGIGTVESDALAYAEQAEERARQAVVERDRAIESENAAWDAAARARGDVEEAVEARKTAQKERNEAVADRDAQVREARQEVAAAMEALADQRAAAARAVAAAETAARDLTAAEARERDAAATAQAANERARAAEQAQSAADAALDEERRNHERTVRAHDAAQTRVAELETARIDLERALAGTEARTSAAERAADAAERQLDGVRTDLASTKELLAAALARAESAEAHNGQLLARLSPTPGKPEADTAS